jgi:hypothetical protein
MQHVKPAFGQKPKPKPKKTADKGGSTAPAAPPPEPTRAGIGGIFYTRKGNFLYKISLYIIIYLELIVSLCIMCIIILYLIYHQWVGTTSRGPMGVRVPLVGQLDYELGGF